MELPSRGAPAEQHLQPGSWTPGNPGWKREEQRDSGGQWINGWDPVAQAISSELGVFGGRAGLEAEPIHLSRTASSSSRELCPAPGPRSTQSKAADQRGIQHCSLCLENTRWIAQDTGKQAGLVFCRNPMCWGKKGWGFLHGSIIRCCLFCKHCVSLDLYWYLNSAGPSSVYPKMWLWNSYRDIVAEIFKILLLKARYLSSSALGDLPSLTEWSWSSAKASEPSPDSDFSRVVSLFTVKCGFRPTKFSSNFKYSYSIQFKIFIFCLKRNQTPQQWE